MFTLVADIMKKILLIILALFICSFTVMAEKVTPPFTIAVGDDSPASDVMLSSTIIPSLEAKGYANFSVGIVAASALQIAPVPPSFGNRKRLFELLFILFR